jgi:hypothetical protein
MAKAAMPDSFASPSATAYILSQIFVESTPLYLHMTKNYQREFMSADGYKA